MSASVSVFKRRAAGASIGFVALAVIAVVLLWSDAASAYFRSSGSATGTATSGKLNAPTNVSAASTAGTGKVTVTWTASTGTPAPTGYYVTRIDFGNATAAACGTSAAAPIAAVTCDDTSVPVGSYTYKVTAVYRSWTATSAASASVSVAKADQTISFTPSAPSTATTGTNYTFTASATSSASVTITSAPSVTCTGTGTNGATVNFVGTGTCTITATQAGTTYYNAVTTTTTISVTAAVVNPTKYLVTAPANVTAGVAFTVTIKAADASNNVLTTYNASPTVNLTSNSGASPNNIAPTLPSGALTFTNGTATASVTLTRADTGRTVTATTGSVTGTSGAITVAAAAPSTLAYVNVSSTGGAVTGTCVGGGSCGASGMNNKAFSAAVAVTDSFGNTSSNLGSSHSVTVSVSPAGSGSFAPSGSSVTLIVPGTGTATSSQQFTYNAPNGSWTSVTLTATSAGYTSVGATLSH